jgi:histidinol-phosphate aminotransferase
MRIMSEPLLARAESKGFPKGAVIIDSNENPLGPCDAARKAVEDMAAQGGRYSPWMAEDLNDAFAGIEELKKGYVQAYPGSSEPLHHSVLAFTSSSKSYVTADPGYEAGMFAAKIAGARVVKVPLAKDYSHDVRAMIAAAPDAGMFYICTPNNPTGTVTSHADIEYLLEHKPVGSIVVVDEAYIHFADLNATAIDLVKADKDVVVLRTFSKIYGMAGLRCGFAIGRPDLITKLGNLSGWHIMPVTSAAAGIVSLQSKQLVPERRKINTDVREATFEWLHKNGYSFVRSQSNCFMVDTKRPAKEAISAMAAQNIFVGRVWPVWPTHVRITVGTQPEMEQFQTAFQRVMQGAVAAQLVPHSDLRRYTDGVLFPS